LISCSLTGETTNFVAPKEQPPRKLSGKKDRNILTLERDSILAEGAKLSGKYTDGYEELVWK